MSIKYSHRFLSLFQIFGYLLLILSLNGCQILNQKEAKLKDDLIGMRLNIAAVQLNNGNPEKALYSLNSLVTKFPNNFKILTMVGMTHLALSNPKTAVSFLRHAYKEEPTIASGLNLSSSLIASDQLIKARNVLRKMLKRTDSYPNRERLFHNIGTSHLKEKNLRGANKYFKLAIDHNPTYYMSLLELGKLMKSAKKYNLAISYLERAARACINCYEGNHLLATEYINRQKPEKALKLLDKFLSNSEASSQDKESIQNIRNLAARYAKRRTSTARRRILSKRDKLYESKKKRKGIDYRIYNSGSKSIKRMRNQAKAANPMQIPASRTSTK